MLKRLLTATLLAALVVCPARATLTTTNSVTTYTSNGVQTAFAVPYKFLNNSHLVVSKTVSSVTTTLVLGTDYSVVGAGASAGGTLTLVTAVANGGTLKIARSTPKQQNCSLRSQGAFAPKSLEDCLDVLEMQVQEMNDGTFTSLIATPITTAQASMAAPSTIPNSTNTNTAGSSASFSAADHSHALAVGPMLSATTTAGQSIPSGPVTIVVFGTVGRDTDSAYTAGTGRYTIPTGKGGDYMISALITWSAAPGTGPGVYIFKNAAEVFRAPSNASVPGGVSGQGISAIINFAAGDIVDIRASQGSGGAVTLSATGTANFFTLKRIQ